MDVRETEVARSDAGIETPSLASKFASRQRHATYTQLMRAACALCKTISELKNSHILPEFLYTPIYDSLHRFHLISSDPANPERFLQKGVRQPLLCGSCEVKLSNWEGYAKRAFMDAKGIRIKRVKNRLLLEGID